ncbi:MAG: hypothetical protein M5R40_11605 [Anaerolineae bacterium]|nr:hypothetical protein [Anaerolineae bacterium]
MLAYPWVYGAIFALSNVLLFRWYLAPPLPPYFLGIVCGMWALASAVSGAGARRQGEATGSATARGEPCAPRLCCVVWRRCG